MWLSSLTTEQRQKLLDLADDIVISDGVLDPNEEIMMDEFRREMALMSESKANSLDLSNLNDTYGTMRERAIVVLNLLRLSYVDGEFDVEEECLLKEIAQVFGFDDEQFRLMDNWVKRLVSLEAEAQDFMHA